MSETTTNILKIPNETVRRPESTVTRAINEDESTFSSVNSISFETLGATARAPVIDIDRLYEAEHGSISQMVRALQLLKQAIDQLTEAKKSQNPMASDRLVQRTQLMLPHIFACRAVGDGFGVVINSLQFGFSNLHGTPLTSGQLDVVWRILRELRTRPAMSLEQGIQLAEELEDCGIEVDPPELGDILEGYESADE